MRDAYIYDAHDSIAQRNLIGHRSSRDMRTLITCTPGEQHRFKQLNLLANRFLGTY